MGNVNLDEYADLVRQEAEADRMRIWHEQEAKRFGEARDQIREALMKVLPADVDGLINGVPAIGWTRTEGFAAARFAREHPDLFEMCSVPVSKQVLNSTRLRQMRPDIFAEYQVRKWKNTIGA